MSLVTSSGQRDCIAATAGKSTWRCSPCPPPFRRPVDRLRVGSDNAVGLGSLREEEEKRTEGRTNCLSEGYASARRAKSGGRGVSERTLPRPKGIIFGRRMGEGGVGGGENPSAVASDGNDDNLDSTKSKVIKREKRHAIQSQMCGTGCGKRFPDLS